MQTVMLEGKVIPDSVREIFDDLKSEIVWTHCRWIMYRQLFDTNEERIDLLNECAGTFFNQLHTVLLDDVILSLSRLTDPHQAFSRENVVLSQLIEKLDENANSKLIIKLKERLEIIRKKCTNFRIIRNRRIAHRDLGTALKTFIDPLPRVSILMIEEALKEVCLFINEFEVYFTESETAYEQSIMTADGNSLIFALKKAVEYDMLVRERIISRKRLRTSKYSDA